VIELPNLPSKQGKEGSGTVLSLCVFIVCVCVCFLCVRHHFVYVFVCLYVHCVCMCVCVYVCVVFSHIFEGRANNMIAVASRIHHLRRARGGMGLLCPESCQCAVLL
jgi:ABC-type transport system involved in Fe-S cluster assembly fused permease/ATPase subunit